MTRRLTKSTRPASPSRALAIAVTDSGPSVEGSRPITRHISSSFASCTTAASATFVKYSCQWGSRTIDATSAASVRNSAWAMDT
jgi:uncharacterized protein (DUF3084 family)